ncbi:hypothetical protein C8R45DRAFT_193856 [Mycena sanguinolenta]|nr:hypothetical protein C8R45DRAFT_193856 [Mycena sanguinolenta]
MTFFRPCACPRQADSDSRGGGGLGRRTRSSSSLIGLGLVNHGCGCFAMIVSFDFFTRRLLLFVPLSSLSCRCPPLRDAEFRLGSWTSRRRTSAFLITWHTRLACVLLLFLSVSPTVFRCVRWN